MARRPMLHADDERYSAAIEELGRDLGPGEAFEVAQLWALDQCRKAQQMSWPTRSEEVKRLAKTWNSASAAALKLAHHLEIDGFYGSERVRWAEEKSGIRLKSDLPRNIAFAKLLRALEQLGFSRRRKETWVRYGPILVKFAATDRIAAPSKSIALATALVHGFRVITESVQEIRPIEFYRSALKVRGGKPCYEAAAYFASAAFAEATTEDTVQKWMQRHRGRIQYYGFHEDTKQQK
jgi:hypothetical protein